MDDFFSGPPDRPEIVAGRYRLPHPETGEEQSWTRATTHAELPEDSFALTRWQLRQLLLGLHQRPDLLRLIESWADQPSKDDLDAVIKTAHEVAGNDSKANFGTAIHGVLQGVDRQWPEQGPDDEWLARVAADAPEWARPHVVGYVTEMRRQGLRPIAAMTERRVINLALGCAGTLDNLFEECDGTVVLGDKKTGRLDYPERAYAIQLAVYNGADYMLGADGGPVIDLRSIPLRTEYAVLVHVDPETGAGSTYRVDLRRGQYGANLAAEVREWRKTRGLLLPYVPPGGAPVQAEWSSTGRHLQAVPSDVVEPMAANLSGLVTGTPPAYEPQVPEPEPGTMAVAGGLRDEQSAPASMDELMRLPKNELQRVLRSLDPGASVAHQRKILAQKILTAQSGGSVATSTPVSTSRYVSNANDPAEITGPIGAEDPTDPASPAFHRYRLAEIAAAQSVAELARIHQAVVRAGGDQAWTDAMTEAARARTSVLDARNGTPSHLENLAACTSSQEIAELWARVTVGGSVPERWTPELVAAAERRLAEVTAPAPAPAANPYAGAS